MTPDNGHVYPFTSTLEGAQVVFSCKTTFHESLTTICSDNALWKPNPREFCANSGTVFN